MKIYQPIGGVFLVALLSACGGGGSDGTSNSETNNRVQLPAGALDGTWVCKGGSLTLGQLLNSNCTDNQVLQGTCTTTIRLVGEQYFAYSGAPALKLSYNTGVIQGPATAAYFHSKTTLGDRLIYERYYPVFSLGSKIGVAALPVSASNPPHGEEFSLDQQGKLVRSSLSPKSLPSNLTYSSASGGPGEIEVTQTICGKI